MAWYSEDLMKIFYGHDGTERKIKIIAPQFDLSPKKVVSFRLCGKDNLRRVIYSPGHLITVPIKYKNSLPVILPDMTLWMLFLYLLFLYPSECRDPPIIHSLQIKSQRDTQKYDYDFPFYSVFFLYPPFN